MAALVLNGLNKINFVIQKVIIIYLLNSKITNLIRITIAKETYKYGVRLAKSNLNKVHTIKILEHLSIYLYLY